MPKLNSTQLFILALVALAILAAAAYLDRTYLPIVVTVVLTVLGVGGAQHAAASGAANVVQGVNLGVPLQAPGDAAVPAAAAPAVPTGMGSAG